MKRRDRCFSFEASGHDYQPLDGIAGIVCRLYCPCCGRVIPADQAWNNLMWQPVELPTQFQIEERSDASDPIN